jgi:hypothetical protein
MGLTVADSRAGSNSPMETAEHQTGKTRDQQKFRPQIELPRASGTNAVALCSKTVRSRTRCLNYCESPREFRLAACVGATLFDLDGR